MSIFGTVSLYKGNSIYIAFGVGLYGAGGALLHLAASTFTLMTYLRRIGDNAIYYKAFFNNGLCEFFSDFNNWYQIAGLCYPVKDINKFKPEIQIRREKVLRGL